MLFEFAGLNNKQRTIPVESTLNRSVMMNNHPDVVRFGDCIKIYSSSSRINIPGKINYKK